MNLRDALIANALAGRTSGAAATRDLSAPPSGSLDNPFAGMAADLGVAPGGLPMIGDLPEVPDVGVTPPLSASIQDAASGRAPPPTNNGSIPPTAGGGVGSAVDAVISRGPAVNGWASSKPLADARAALADAAARKMEAGGGAPGGNPFSASGQALQQIRSANAGAGIRSPVGAGLSSAPGIGAQLAALGGANAAQAAPQTLASLIRPATGPSAPTSTANPQQAAMVAEMLRAQNQGGSKP